VRTQVTDPGLEQLAALKELETLYLRANPIHGTGLPALAGLPRLTALDLGGTFVDDSGAQALSRLGQLSWLSLARTRVTDASLVHLPRSLRTLYLTRNPVTDAGLDALLQLPLLRELDLRGTNVSAEAQARLTRERGVRLMSATP
jgi:Leucine-rich repeat (LRR) protein